MADPSEHDVVFRVLDAGASSVVFTNAPVAQLLATIRQAASAPQWFAAGKSQLVPVVSALRDGPDQVRLSSREIEVLAMLQDGCSVKAIALRLLGISVSTTTTYVQRLYDKLDASNRSQALISAARRGLTPDLPTPRGW